MSTRLPITNAHRSLCAGRIPGHMCSPFWIAGLKVCPVGHSLVPVNPSRLPASPSLPALLRRDHKPHASVRACTIESTYSLHRNAIGRLL